MKGAFKMHRPLEAAIVVHLSKYAHILPKQEVYSFLMKSGK